MKKLVLAITLFKLAAAQVPQAQASGWHGGGFRGGFRGGWGGRGGWGWGWGVLGGLAVGTVIGESLAAPAYYSPYYAYPAYGYPAYSYSYRPAYYPAAPAPQPVQQPTTVINNYYYSGSPMSGPNSLFGR